jgi:hypothetical protein
LNFETDDEAGEELEIASSPPPSLDVSSTAASVSATFAVTLNLRQLQHAMEALLHLLAGSPTTTRLPVETNGMRRNERVWRGVCEARERRERRREAKREGQRAPTAPIAIAWLSFAIAHTHSLCDTNSLERGRGRGREREDLDECHSTWIDGGWMDEIPFPKNWYCIPIVNYTKFEI